MNDQTSDGVDWESTPDVEANPGKVTIHEGPDIEIGPIDGPILDPVQAGLTEPNGNVMPTFEINSEDLVGSLYLQPSVVFATWRLANMVVEISGRCELPNAFHRLTQRLILGITWELKNPAIHETWWWKVKRITKRVCCGSLKVDY